MTLWYGHTPVEEFQESLVYWDEQGYETLINPYSVTEIDNLYPRLDADEVAERCGLAQTYQHWTPETMQERIEELRE